MASVDEIEVFADIGCPYTHVGLRRFVAHRAALGRARPVLRVRAWPLELVNGAPLRGSAMVPKIAALRRAVAPDLFAGFDAGVFPASTLPALASVAASYRLGCEQGEQFSLAVRAALFEQGRDVSDPDVLAELRAVSGVGDPTVGDADAVEEDFREGTRRGVIGSPHFFVPDADFFCPSLQVATLSGELTVSFDEAGFGRFVSAALT